MHHRRLDQGAIKTLKALKTVLRQLRTEDDLTKLLKEVSDLESCLKASSTSLTIRS